MKVGNVAVFFSLFLGGIFRYGAHLFCGSSKQRKTQKKKQKKKKKNRNY